MNNIQYNHLVSSFENSDTCRAHYDNAWGNGGIGFQILNLNNRCRRAASPGLFTLADSFPRYSFIRWLDGTQSQSGCFGVYRNLLPPL